MTQEPLCVLLEPGSRLSDVQTLRALEAIAILRAKLDAIQAGEVSTLHTHLYSWTVDVEPSDADCSDGFQLVVRRELVRTEECGEVT